MRLKRVIVQFNVRPRVYIQEPDSGTMDYKEGTVSVGLLAEFCRSVTGLLH